MRPLVFNADDYGLTPSVSKGILRAAGGVVRSTTVMANLVSKEELGWLKDSPLKAGAHLNLTIGPPLTSSFPRRLLNHAGCFDKAPGLRSASWDNSKLQFAVAKEWSAQIELLQASGLKLTHLDSHHHVHLLPALYSIALGLAKRYGLGIRTRAAQQKTASKAGVATPKCFEERFFGMQQISRDVILQLLAGSSHSSAEVMCHPGLVDARLLTCSSYCFERVGELKTLGDVKLRSMLEQQGWNLCGYDQI